jgi:rubredoxin
MLNLMVINKPIPKTAVFDTLTVYFNTVKISYSCPKCGEILLNNKCKSCGHEFMPETPKPIKGPEIEKKPKKLKKGKFHSF